MSEPLWGVMAEYASADDLLAAAQAAREAGFRRIEAYSPFPVEGLDEAVGFGHNRVSLITFIGGLLGGLGGYFLQWYSAVLDYPINVGGRPPHSWPMFVPVTFEMTVLGGALAAFLAAIIGNRLPDLSHPVFDSPDFDLAMRNRFFLCLRPDSEGFDAAQAASCLDKFKPLKRTELRR
jgi:hypothetical protein